MATVPVGELKQMDKAFLACSYGLMILQDEGLELDAEKVNDLMRTAGLDEEQVPGFYARFFVTNMKD